MISTETLGEFVRILGVDGVESSPERLTEASTATFATRNSILAVLRPATREQVQECVRAANLCSVALYPVSTGKNWGYGSRVPPADAMVLLDLGRMNRILAWSEPHAYVTVEPGVTQRQLVDFLADRGSRLMLDCTGASPDASVVANSVERGFGHTPYGDHFSHVCDLEVVLPTGECIETGHGRFGSVASAPTYRWGVGPVLDGLFSQSNFGIVTRCTLWLMPKPEYFEAFFFRCDNQGSLEQVIDALRPLRLDGTLKSACHIGNDYKVISGLRQYPWDRTDGRTPLQPEVLGQLAKEYGFGHWNGSGALYGTQAQVAEARRLLKRALKGKVTKLTFLNDRLLDLAGRFAGLCKFVTGWDLRRTLDLVRPIYGLMQGAPTDYALRSAYWRKRTPAPAEMDPDRDRCGLIWCAPVAPISGEHAARLASLTSEILLRHCFEPALSITLLTERTLACIVSIGYDRDVPGEDERAMACHDETIAALRQAGYHFYRLGIQSMGEARTDGAYGELLRNLKDAIDPAAILAPGRYQAFGKGV
jgi:4-cresol dehydrogenase (hydroxylating) flavoprotein subunit